MTNVQIPGTVILEAIVGSTAYGMANKNSDIDRLGIFVAPTESMLGLHQPKDSIVHTKPDSTYHELQKFIKLALVCNPTITELLWMENYEVCTMEGATLIGAREAFLSAIAEKAYGGYAISQLKRLESRNDGSFSSNTRGRYEKHARHLLRLLHQGYELKTTGRLTVKLANPEEILAAGKLPPEELKELFEHEFDVFNKAESVLPPQPDTDRVEQILLGLRRLHYKRLPR